jgi:pyruvate carboxylase subunit B
MEVRSDHEGRPDSISTSRLSLTDTTFRDGNQCLLDGHLRGVDIYPLARALDRAGFFAFEAFGGATFETYLRLGDDPWDYLRQLRQATPNTPLQALVRGQNLVGHRNFADDAVELFVRHAASCGIDVFRIFDPLNDPRNMEVAIAAARGAGKRVQGALCYAVSPAHDLDLWCGLAGRLAQLGVDDLVVKDTAGLLCPQAAWELVTALKEATRLPVVVHSHCSGGMAPMAYMAAVEAGAAGIDTALSPLAGGSSQPATESVVAALAGGDYDTGLDLELLVRIKTDLEAALERNPNPIPAAALRTESEILSHHMPASMLADVARLLAEHEASDRRRDVLAEVPRVRRDLGFPPLVAPIRQMIAAQAMYNVLSDDRYATVTQELKDYLQGLYGRPPQTPAGEIRRAVLGNSEPVSVRPADLIEPQVDRIRRRRERRGESTGAGEILNEILFPDLARRSAEPAAPPSTPEPKAPPVSPAEASSEIDATAIEVEPELPVAPAPPPAEFEVEVEGEIFKVRVGGSALSVTPLPAPSTHPERGAVPSAARAARRGAVSAPMQGSIVKVAVEVGDQVKAGDVVAVLEAMKMQNDIVAPEPGAVLEIYVKTGDVVSANEPLLAIG